MEINGISTTQPYCPYIAIQRDINGILMAILSTLIRIIIIDKTMLMETWWEYFWNALIIFDHAQRKFLSQN